VAARDGDGWARCAQGHRHWGRFGAVGLLAYVTTPASETPAPAEPGDVRVLLVRRGRLTQHGGTWGVPGGARDSDESAIAAALREAAEECGLPPGGVRVQGMLVDDHEGWSYQTFVAQADDAYPVSPAWPEISDASWFPAGEVGSLPLHPGFAGSWPVLSQAVVPLTIIVDVANVMGARPDGWWRDRAGAAQRLHTQIAALAERGLPSLPPDLGLPALDLWYPSFVLVVEGATRRATFPEADRVQVVAAPGSGDDTIAAQAAQIPGPRLVITADRELRRRCESAGATVTGPTWLLNQI
jgi:8-oxo-dGTP pyrophosphatase MutT (NUDIX family)